MLHVGAVAAETDLGVDEPDAAIPQQTFGPLQQFELPALHVHLEDVDGGDGLAGAEGIEAVDGHLFVVTAEVGAARLIGHQGVEFRIPVQGDAEPGRFAAQGQGMALHPGLARVSPLKPLKGGRHRLEGMDAGRRKGQQQIVHRLADVGARIDHQRCRRPAAEAAHVVEPVAADGVKRHTNGAGEPLLEPP